jgi:hypothetical protein
MNRWTDEKEFEKHFYSLNDPDQELKDLAQWREFQTKVVSKFIDQIRLVAGEHYTNLDHFLLELLQNADDNTYNEGVTPTVKITLNHDYFQLENNEKGFTAQDLFAITYSAASTKIRQKTGATFIGEKGIGFKSVFAVADYVDIHSPPYHFRLNNGEFIIPHQIPPKEVTGTRILLRLPKADTNIPAILSDRLTSLCENAQEFILFLQKIERLNFDDHISSSQREVIAERDIKANFYLVESVGQERTYFTHRYKITIPKNVVKLRFRELNEELEREIIFAVPYPSNDLIKMQENGLLFCFLPTKVKTGTPIHIQIDAKTTGNRENLLEFEGSEWNRTVFQGLAEEFINMIKELTKKHEFAKRLPEYLPWNIENQDLRNNDLQILMTEVKEKLKKEEIIRDRHGEYWPAKFVKMVPQELESVLYEDKYERALSSYLVREDDDYQIEGWDDDEVVTLVDPEWARKYTQEITALGVEPLGRQSCLQMLREGPPSKIDIRSEEAVRKFLKVVIELADSLEGKYFYNPYRKAIEDLKQCPIFPLNDGKSLKWGALTQEIMWIKSDTPESRGTGGTFLVDPKYTYTPGGGVGRSEIEEIRELNRRFRKLLEDCEIDSYTFTAHLRRTVIRRLQELPDDLKDENERRFINEAWFRIYQGIWNRKTTIIREEGGENYWQELITELQACKIPIKKNGKKWSLVPLDRAFIGPRFNTENNLAKIYRDTEAPIIDLDYLEKIALKAKAKKQRKIDWEDWKRFFIECGVNKGPYLVTYDLSNDPAYRHSSNKVYQNLDNKLASAIREAIQSSWEFRTENAKTFYLVSTSGTICLDSFTDKLLKKKLSSDFLARKLGPIWESRNNYRTEINYLWGRKSSPRVVIVENTLLEEQLRKSLIVKSDKGLKLTTECFEDNQINRAVLGKLVPYVDCKSNNYNRELLEHAGMILSVRPEDIINLIIGWYKNTPPGFRNTEAFEPYLEMVVRASRWLPNYISQLASYLKLYHPASDKLIPFKTWKGMDLSDYPASLVEGVIEALDQGGRATLDGILATLFACNPLESHEEALTESLVRLGRFCEANGIEGVRESFEKALEDCNLHAFGRHISTLKLLPILWDIPPSPKRVKGVLKAFVDHANQRVFQDAVDILGWPRMSRLSPTLQIRGEGSNLDESTVRRIFYVFEELIRGVEGTQPQLKRRIENLGIFSSETKISQGIVNTGGINVIVQLDGGKNEYPVPYWFDGKNLFIAKEHHIVRVLPEFVDLYCGTTFLPSFRYIWNDKDLISRVAVGNGSPSDQSAPDHPAKGSEFGGDLLEGGTKKGLETGLDDEDDNGDSTGEGTDQQDPSKGTPDR